MEVGRVDMYEYRARVVRWVDGDTVDLEVDLGFRMSTSTRFRLQGIDTPEVRGPEKEEGKKAAGFCQALLPKGASCIVVTTKAGKYGRWLARIWACGEDGQRTGLTVNQQLLEAGLAKVYGS